ncbi:MAG: starch-binding protein [Reichenbachiella sp.]
MKTRLTIILTLLTTLCAVGQNENRDRPFSWDNSTLYFVIQDRFENGNTSNDHSYGRGQDGNGNDYGLDEVGGFHGGDFAGLTQKINEGYFDDLGVNAIWFSAPYEQIHGWVSGGSNGDFRHYAYHGYYGLDWTEMDANFGTEEEFRAFADAAHEHGIRLVMDVVMNHVGYNTLQDMEEYGFGCADSSWKGWRPSNGETWASIHDLFIDYSSNCQDWSNWWSGDWIRAGLPTYPAPGGDEKTSSLAGLPDIITESGNQVGIPPILLNKWSANKLGQEEAELTEFFNRTGHSRTVRNHFVKWLSDWVREYGIDGFRVDTEKHVEGTAWKALKDESVLALQEWKSNNPSKKLDDLPFWMVGENFGYGYGRSQYHVDSGYDGLINFGFQGQAGNIGSLENIYSSYAGAINSASDWNALSYISSHDTELFDRSNLMNAGTSLLLAPGSVQIFYGDETGRPEGPLGGDQHQGTRSYMNWNSINTTLLAHWQKLGQFRRNHLSIGGGSHQQLSTSPYTFSRTLDSDRVVVVVSASGNTTVNVSSIFADGTSLRDFYTGSLATVSNGTVSFDAHSNGILLIEEENVTNRPSLVVNPESSHDPVSISMTASSTDADDPNPIIYYTTDLSLSTNTLGAWMVYTGEVTFTETVDVQLVAQNVSGALSSVVTRKYSVGAIDGFTLYIHSECEVAPLIYYWEEEPSVLADVAWPGVSMTPLGSGCDGWFSYELPGILSTNYIINQCSGQSPDLVLDSQGAVPCVPGNQRPTVNIDPEGGGVFNLGETVSVTLWASDDVDVSPEIRYTLDGSVPSQASTLYTGVFDVTTDVTVRAVAYDSEGLESFPISEDFTFTTPSNAMTIYYKGSLSNPTIYFWANSPGSESTTWPGDSMEDEGDGWYSFAFEEATSTNLIFSNNGTNQTGDLSRINNGWYDNGVWFDIDPRDPPANQPPVLSVSPVGGQFDIGETVLVTLSATDDNDSNPVIHYTLDGSVPSQSSTMYTGTITVVTDLTVKAASYDSEGLVSNLVSEDYAFVTPTNAMTVHYKGSLNNPTIYFWANSPGSESSTWPGQSMVDEGDGWYSFAFEEATSTNIIFSSNGANQTPDHSRTNTGWYTDGVWYDTKPVTPDGMTVYFKPNDYTDPEVYYWSVTPTGQGTSWPGETMTDVGNGWYSYTLEGAECANIIFSNNGSSQTENLSLCGDVWYENGQATISQPTARAMSENYTDLVGSFSLVEVYPNPSTGVGTFEISLLKAQRLNIRIYSIGGQVVDVVYSGTMESGTNKMTYTIPDKGLYYYQIESNEINKSGKIMVK